MATVLDPATLICFFGDGRQAVAYGRWSYSEPEVFGPWRLHCHQCLNFDDLDSRELQIVYLDPARQRRPPADPAPDLGHAGVPDDHPDPV
jgi:hypothetical protein